MRAFVLILLPVFFLACNQETAKNDTDTGVTDDDVPATEETVTK